MKTNVLVTGANGQLALTLKERYASNSDAIIYHFVSKEELDITSKVQIQNIFKEYQYNYCINCAAYTNVDEAESNRLDAKIINADAVRYLAESCKENNTVLIHISTDYVFDGNTNKPYTTIDKPNPLNQYGKSKRTGEVHIENLLSRFFIIRSSWLYSKYKKNFLLTIVDRIKKNDALTITTEQTGTPTSCEALSKFIHFLISSKELKYGIYHFSNLGEATWFEFAKQIASHFKSYDESKLIAIPRYQSKAKRPRYSVLDVKETLKIYPNIKSWQKAVDDTIYSIIKQI